MKRLIFPALFALRAVAAPIEVAPIVHPEPVDFAREVYPVLKRNCLACHNSTRAKANLNLESPQLMRTGGDGGPALIDAKPAESLLFVSAAHLDDDMLMPPPDNKVKAVAFTPAELALLKLWIEQGGKGDAVADAEAALQWRGFADAPVNSVAFSRDGRTLAAAAGNRVRLFEPATGRLLAELGDPKLGEMDAWKGQVVADRDAVMSVAFGSDGVLATGGFREVRVWRRGTRAVVREIGKAAEKPTAMAASADGRRASLGDAKGAVWLWDLQAEKPEAVKLEHHATPVTALAFSPDGAVLISTAEDRSVRLWSLAENRTVMELTAPAVVRSLAVLSAASEIVAGCADGTLRAWSWPGGAEVWNVKVQEQPVDALAAVGDGAEFVWIGANGRLHFVGTKDRKELREVAPEHPAAAEVLEFERELKIAQARVNHFKNLATKTAEDAKKQTDAAKKAADDLVKARADLRAKAAAELAAREAAAADTANKGLEDAAKKSADGHAKAETVLRGARANVELAGRLASEGAAAQAGAAAALVAAEVDAGDFQALLDAAKKRAAEPLPVPRDVAVSPDGAWLLACDVEGNARRIAAETGALLDARERVGKAVFLPWGELLCLGTDGAIRITSARPVWALERVIGSAGDAAVFADRVTALAISPDGKLLATGSGVPSRNGAVKLWRIADGTQILHVEKAHGDTINGICFSPGGDAIATAGGDRFARVWNAVDGTRIANLEGHSGHVLSVAWRADGLSLATAGAEGAVRHWDTATWRAAKTKADFGNEVTAIAFAGVGDALVSASAEQVRLGDQALPSSSGVLFTATSEDAGRYVAAGGQDGVVRVWTAEDRKLWRTFSAKP